MSHLEREIREEDEVRHLLRRPLRGVAPPPFSGLPVRRSRINSVGLAIGAIALILLLAGVVGPSALRGVPAASRTPLAVSTGVPQVAIPTVLAPGATQARVTPCEEIPMPGHVPWSSEAQQGAERSASSQDVVNLSIRKVTVDAKPAVLSITAAAAQRSVFWSGAISSSPPPTVIAGRTVTVMPVAGSGLPTPPPDPTPFAFRSAVVAQWSESQAACPYFAAWLWSAGTDTGPLEAEIVRIIESLPPTPAASAPALGVLPEADAWARVRALFLTGPVAMPTWLPSGIDRSRIEVRRLSVSPTREYEVVYRDGSGAEALSFRLGPAEAVRGSGTAFCCVRASRATFTFDSGLRTGDPTPIGARQLQWTEQARTLSIWSDRVKGEDILRIGWELDRTTGSPNPYPSARSKAGACASTASAAETVLRYLALTGSHDRDAIVDCYALDRVILDGPELLGGSADLPTTRNARIDHSSAFAGRVQVQVTWSFTSDPGGAWGPDPTRFFTLGSEDGRWRIYESGTGPFLAVP